MALDQELPRLHVEGDSDLHIIVHLLARHGVVLDKDLGPVMVKPHGSVGQLLNAVPLAARASTDRAVGFVLDADQSLRGRWEAVRNKLDGLGLTFPAEPLSGGYIGGSDDGVYRVGVWIMPDNATPIGSIEKLVETLVPEGDSLFTHAVNATWAAGDHGARLSGLDVDKAQLHCWLAWQKEPGLTLGQAIKAHYFDDDSPQALAFVEWFRDLYRDALPPEPATDA